MIEPTVSEVTLKGQKYPVVEFTPKPGKRITLLTGLSETLRPETDEGYIIRVYPNNSFMMSDKPANKIVDGVVVGVQPESPRIYDSTYRYIVAGI